MARSIVSGIKFRRAPSKLGYPGIPDTNIFLGTTCDRSLQPPAKPQPARLCVPFKNQEERMAKKPRSTDIPANNKTKAELEGLQGLGGFEISGSYSGQLEVPGDHDWVRVTLSAGST